MGLLKGQLLKVIEWVDATQDTMVYKFPFQPKQEIMMGSQLIVRESQVCIFLSSGKMADVFPPGRYKLDTGNMPVLTKLMSWKYGFNSPFKCDVYYVNTKQFINQKWGTSNPIMMRDPDFGMVRFRAFGTYSFRVSDAPKFFREVAGTLPSYKITSLTDQLKSILISGIGEAVAALKVSALDLAMQLSRISDDTKRLIAERMNNMGIEMSSMAIENISLPEELEKEMDRHGKLNIARGTMDVEMQRSQMDILKTAAGNSGAGGAMGPMMGVGMGLGMGRGMGNAMGGMVNNAMQPQQVQPKPPSSPKAPPPAAPQIKCACGATNPETAKFCNNCGAKVLANVKCPACGHEVKAGAKFCPDCGGKMDGGPAKCADCGHELKPGAKFCPDCGKKV